LYKSFNLFKGEIFSWLNTGFSTKDEIVSTIYSIFVTFNSVDTVNSISMYNITSNNFIYVLFSSIILGIKSSIMIFTFIWARASFPRIRFDQLMSFCWTVLLPIVVAFIILVPCILYGFDILPNNIALL
jgi:NADH-ubiquinone oxidoreductase chain 1